MGIKRYSANGYWKDRMGYKTNGISLSGIKTFAEAQTFLNAMKAYSNLALLRVAHTINETERVSGQTPGTGHFDLAGYVARLVFYNYAAEDAGDSPSMSLTIPAPKDTIIEETKDGIWVVKDTIGVAIANLIGTAIGAGSDIEFVRGEVPEN